MPGAHDSCARIGSRTARGAWPRGEEVQRERHPVRRMIDADSAEYDRLLGHGALSGRPDRIPAERMP